MLGITLLFLALMPAVSGCSLFDSDAGTASETPAPTVAATSVAEPRSTRPALTATATPPTPTPPASQFTQAPDGRSGIEALDALIEGLLGPAPDEALARSGRVNAGPLVLKGVDSDGRSLDLPPEDWIALLESSERSLFAVVEADPVEFPARDYNVVLRVVEPDEEAETFWNFAVRDGRLVELVRAREVELRRLTAGKEGGFNGAAGSFQLPSVEHLYSRYYVLPPPEYMPQQPPAHPLSVRTGDPGVDGVLEALESNAPHPNALIGLVEPTAINRQCQTNPEALADGPVDAAFIERWALDMAGGAVGVHAIVDLPEGYQPASEHLLIAIVRKGQFWWETAGILEAGGRIVGIVSPAWPIADTALSLPNGALSPIDYRACLPLPPAEYVVPPPNGRIASMDPARRSGIALVDGLLNALQAGDAAALDALTDYAAMACVRPDPNFGQGYGVACKDDEAEGTLVEVLPVGVCHGEWLRRDDALEIAPDEGLALYAMVAPGSVVLATPDGRSERWTLSETGRTGISKRCGDQHPDRMLAADDTRFLLPPP